MFGNVLKVFYFLNIFLKCFYVFIIIIIILMGRFLMVFDCLFFECCLMFFCLCFFVF